MSIELLEQRIDQIETHTSTMNKELGEVRDRLIKIEANLDWIIKTYWIIATASIGSLITALITLILK